MTDRTGRAEQVAAVLVRRVKGRKLREFW